MMAVRGSGALVVVIFLAGLMVASQGGAALAVYVPYAAVATLLVLRRPRNSVGWLLLITGWTFAVSWLEVAASAASLADGTAPTLVRLVAWAKWWWTLPVVLSLVAVIAIVFPSGSLPRGRWHGPAAATVILLAAIDLAFAAWPALVISTDGSTFLMANPFWPTALRPLDLPSVPMGGGMLVFGVMIGAIGAILVRYRRADGVERLQLRWLVAGVASIALAIPFGLGLYALGGGGLSWIPAIVAFTLPPLAIGIAVLRYRLYEIDRIISRTIGWALVSGTLVTVFAGGVVGLQALLAGFTQGQTLAVAVSTLLAFALFQPLRRRIQRLVDRRFDRARYNAERTAGEFAERVRNRVDLDAVTADLARTSRAAVRPHGVDVWLRGAP